MQTKISKIKASDVKVGDTVSSEFGGRGLTGVVVEVGTWNCKFLGSRISWKIKETSKKKPTTVVIGAESFVNVTRL